MAGAGHLASLRGTGVGHYETAAPRSLQRQSSQPKVGLKNQPTEHKNSLHLNVTMTEKIRRKATKKTSTHNHSLHRGRTTDWCIFWLFVASIFDTLLNRDNHIEVDTDSILPPSLIFLRIRKTKSIDSTRSCCLLSHSKLWYTRRPLRVA